MNASYILFLIVYVLSVSISEGQDDKAGAYHHTRLFETEVLYVADKVALWRTVRYYPGEAPEILYNLYRTSWIGEPELSGATGDASEQSLVSGIKYIAWIASARVLVGRGADPTRDDSDSTSYFAMPAATREATFYKTEEELRAALKKLGVVEFSLIPSELCFRRFVADVNDFRPRPNEGGKARGRKREQIR